MAGATTGGCVLHLGYRGLQPRSLAPTVQLGRVPVEAIEVARRDPIHEQKNEDVGGPEGVVDHGAVTDEGSEAEIGPDERWQPAESLAKGVCVGQASRPSPRTGQHGPAHGQSTGAR